MAGPVDPGLMGEVGVVATGEEGTDPVKNDPEKPASQKREEIEKEGQKPLDPADK